ncbi:hypothetical protein [Actinoplanes couchii]|uniref:Uncharacterized protein n=1 Tax=Actinoplanes couchii TaxID=403638 RepID=A0ABQ3XKX9_9ACTN|nr:hypothetical protein [Actinoplanes couchii]MDR6319456.1 hypothetical protein [Actinoplanes couchii]GID59151.1 hypothetical protein Aco03nite_075550 [Actinoplanes couchii]
MAKVNVFGRLVEPGIHRRVAGNGRRGPASLEVDPDATAWWIDANQVRRPATSADLNYLFNEKYKDTTVEHTPWPGPAPK